MNKIKIPWATVLTRLANFDSPDEIIYGVPKGGMILTAFLRQSKVTYDPNQATIILDDIVDSGKTRIYYKQKYPKTKFVSLFDASEVKKDEWLVFPWEADHPGGEESVQDNIVRTLQFLGEDVTREGLQDTPNRVVKSWGELYAGYSKDPESLFTVFESDGYDQIVLLKDIELYSMCEHHMLPFYGKAHVAYIPKKKVIGISKLARVVDLFARRLQIQERIGTQVTALLDEQLNPLGSACIIEASHMCMRMRGVNKQNSIMITSSLTGAFMENPQARQELLQLIK